jgi:DNA-directed RNA polymerase specialized sigma24 family protein
MWECIEDVDLRLDLEAASERLTDKQRQVVVLYLAGYTQAEIGTVLETGKAAVCRCLQRARALISEVM